MNNRHKAKIAILAPYIGLTNRGTETFVIELTRQLRDHYSIDVYSRGISKQIKDNIKLVKYRNPNWFRKYSSFYSYLARQATKGNGITSQLAKGALRIIYIFPVFFPENIAQQYFSKYVFENFLKKTRYDLIYPNNGIPGACLAKALRDKYGIPFIYTGHGGISRYERSVLRFKPDLYIAISQKAYEWARQFSNKVIKINNGVDCSNFIDYKNKKLNSTISKRQHPIVLCVGAFTEYKRQGLLVKAISKLNKGTVLLIGAKAECEETLKELCEKHIPKRYLIKRVPYHEMPYYYSYCDVFSLPSKEEPFGIVYLEAMSANKPIVAPNDEVRREIVGNAGILCDVENTREYSNAIDKCYKKDWKNIPRERVKKYFSWEVVSRKYKTAIDSIVSPKLNIKHRSVTKSKS